jgi:hypothetical protein
MTEHIKNPPNIVIAVVKNTDTDIHYGPFWVALVDENNLWVNHGLWCINRFGDYKGALVYATAWSEHMGFRLVPRKYAFSDKLKKIQYGGEK